MTENTEIVRRFIELCQSGSGGYEILAADIFIDVNVPEWRFQIQGVEAFLQWFKSEMPAGQTILSAHRIDTSDGFVLETESLVDQDGVEHYVRQVWLAAVSSDVIQSLTLYCTGVWSPETVQRQRAQAPMIRG